MMVTDLKLYMILLGCTPVTRNIEQHDIYFGIGRKLSDLIADMNAFWGDGGKLHIDAWRQVSLVSGFNVTVHDRESEDAQQNGSNNNLFFINLGGYKENEFEEFHYKMLTIASNKNAAMKTSKETAFFRHTGIKTAPAHIDDKYGIDVDDLFNVEDILSDRYKNKYSLSIIKTDDNGEDPVNLGYLPLEKIK